MRRNLTRDIRVFCSFLFALLFAIGCGKEAPAPKVQSLSLAVLQISDTPTYDFGLKPIASVNDHTFTVTNSGSVPATMVTSTFGFSLSFTYKDGTYPGTGGTCTETLNPLDSCTVVVSFAPQFSGSTQAVLKISYNNGSADTLLNGPLLTGQGN